MNYKDPEYKRNRAIVLSDAPNCAICGRPGADTADLKNAKASQRAGVARVAPAA